MLVLDGIALLLQSSAKRTARELLLVRSHTVSLRTARESLLETSPIVLPPIARELLLETSLIVLLPCAKVGLPKTNPTVLQQIVRVWLPETNPTAHHLNAKRLHPRISRTVDSRVKKELQAIQLGVVVTHPELCCSSLKDVQSSSRQI